MLLHLGADPNSTGLPKDAAKHFAKAQASVTLDT